MDLLSGFKDIKYRIRTYVPTTVYDDNVGVVKAYRGKRLVGREYFRLQSLPVYDRALRTLVVNKAGMKVIRRTEDSLLKKLGN